MSQNELGEMIKNFQKENSENFQKLNERFDQLTATIKKEIRDEFQPKVDELKEEQESLREIVTKQQTFLEQLDTNQRAGNLIVLGVTEEELRYGLSEATTDRQKIDLILLNIECNAAVKSVTRLGERIDDRPRPMKVTLADPSESKSVLECARKLSDLRQPLRSIRIKKDSHPAVRKEWGRLHEAMRREKDKPANAACAIFIDYKNRELRRNHEVIDKFQSPFI